MTKRTQLARVGEAPARKRLLHGMLLGTTAIVGVTLASPAAAQTVPPSAQGGAGGADYLLGPNNTRAAGGTSGTAGTDASYYDGSFSSSNGGGGGGANARGGNARDGNGVVANSGGTAGTGGTGAGTAGGAGMLVSGGSAGFAAGGGGGGDGLIVATTTVANATGGAGGAGATTTYTGGGGGGGAGGAGLTASVGSSATFIINGNVSGGAGGAGGASIYGSGGNGGGGGYGVSTASASTVTVAAGVTISGGVGGAGGAHNNTQSVAGSGGAGGVGIYTAGSLINSGTIVGGAGGAVGALAGAAVAGADGAGVIGANLSVTNAGTISGGGSADAITFTGGTNTLTLSSAGLQGTINGSIGVTGTLSLDAGAAQNATVANVIHDTSGAGTLNKIGTGTITLTGTNTYTGGTTFGGGTLNVGNVRALGIAGTLSFSGGTLQYSAANITDYSGRFSTAANQAYSVDTNGQAVTLATALTSSGGTLAKSGAGTLTLAGNDTYTGMTTIQAGTLTIATGAALSNSSSVALTGNTAVLSINSPFSASTINNLSGVAGSQVNLVGKSVTTINQSNNTTFAGTLSSAPDPTYGGGIVTKTGAGTLTLTGANSAAAGQVTGTTNVNAGTLAIDGTFGDTAANSAIVNVNTGGTLIGSGLIDGSVNVNGGMVSAGDRVGTLTVAGNFTLGNMATSLFELGTPGVVGGATNDLINVGGNLTLGGALQVVSFSDATMTPVSGDYRLFNYGGTLTGNFAAVTAPGMSQTTTVATNVPGQVNLAVRAIGQSVQYFDGTDLTGAVAGPQGGTGTWNAINTNWTGQQTTINDIWRSGVGIFTTAGGTVTVADAEAFQGLQFSANGYQLTGAGTLTLAGNPYSTPQQSFVNVDAGVAATIANTITGAAGIGLVKLGAGTLVLSGANTYTGVTTVSAGVLQGTTTSIVGSSIVDNGVVNFQQAMAGTSARAISGTGVVQVNGGGNVSLTGAITVTGGVQVGTGAVATLSNVSNANTAAGSNVVTFTGAGATLNVANGGSVTSTNGNAAASNVANNTINNAGLLAGNATYTAVYLQSAAAGTNNVTNAAAGTIRGYDGIYSRGDLMLTNAGTITALVNNGITALGVSTITNQAGGVINATATGGFGIDGEGESLTAVNAGTINADYGVVKVRGAGTLNNTGTINGATVGVSTLGGTLALTNSATIAASAGEGVNFVAGGSVTNGGSISGSTVGVLSTGGALTLNSTGTIRTTGGTFAIQSTGAFGDTVTLGSGSTTTGTVSLGDGADTLTLVTGATATGTLDGGAGIDTLALDGTGAGALNSVRVINFENGVKQGSGTWTLNGTTTPASPTAFAVLAGTLNVAGGNALADNASLTVAAGGTLGLLASETIDTLAGAGAVTLGANTLSVGGGNGSATFGGVASGTGGLTKVGTGTQTLSGANTYTGATTINAGTLSLGASNVLAEASAVSVGTGATFDLGANSDTVASLVLAGTLAGTGTLTAASYTLNAGTVNGNLGTGTLTQASGTSTLSGTTNTGTVNVTGGTLALGASNRIVDSANVAVASGATLNLGANSDTVGTLALNGTLAGTGTLTAASYALNGAAVNANLGTGLLGQLGGTSTLNGIASAATVSVQTGTLVLGASNRIIDTAAVLVSPGATLNLGANSDTVASLNLGGTLAGTGTLTAAQYALNGATVNANLGTGTLVQQSGTSVLSGTSAAGITAIGAGTLRLGAADRIVDSSAVTLSFGSTFDLAGFNETVGTLQGQGTVALGAGTLSTGVNNTDATYAGVVSGTGSLTKVGTGTLTLTGANTLTGTLNANAGTLLLLGSTAGGALVQGGTLAGVGQIAGNLLVSSGTLLIGTPTNAIGTMSVGTLAVSGGTSVFDFSGAKGGFTADRLNVAGAAVLTGGTLTARATEASANYRVMQTYTLIQAGSVTGTFANTGFSAAANASDLFYRLRYDLVPNAVVLEVRKQIDFAAGLAAAGASGNQLGVANALNGSALTASDAYATVLNQIQALGTGDRLAALDSISGEGLADVTTSVGLMNRRFTDLLRRRLATAGSRSADASLVAAAVNGGRGLAEARATGQLANASSFADGASDPSARGGAWVQSFGGYGLLRGQAGSANLYDQSYGIAGGVDGRFGPLTVGLAGAGTGVDTRVTARSTKGNGTIYQGAGYLAYDDGTIFANAVGTYFSGEVTTRRSVFLGTSQVGVASGRSRAHGIGGSLSAGYRIDLGGGTKLTPQVSIDATRVKRDAFTETGIGVLNLSLAKQRRTLYRAEGETRLSHVFALGGNGGTVEPYIGGGFEANWGNRAALDTIRITGAPVGTGAFLIDGANLARYTGLATGGIDGHPTDRLTLGVGLQARRSPRQKDGAVQIHARIAF